MTKPEISNTWFEISGFHCVGEDNSRPMCPIPNRCPYQTGLIGSPSTMVEGEPSGPTGTSPMSVTR